MTGASSRGHRATRILHRAPSVVLLLVMALSAGCQRPAPQPASLHPIDASHVRITAWLDAQSPCQQATVALLDELEDGTPDRLDVRIIDIATHEGRERLKEHGLDTVAIAFGGHTTVAWGEGDSRRTVSFMHPAGFTWTHDDLRQAVAAALQGHLQPADPSEAEGVRLMDISVRGQSIRVGDAGQEIAQLVIQGQIVLEVTAPHGTLSPAQRVATAAKTLSVILERPFTPNRLTIEPFDGGVAVKAFEEQLLVATPSDAATLDLSPRQLADQWRLAIRQALIEAALQRTPAPDPNPVPVEPQTQPSPEGEATPANALPDPLLPPE